MCGLDSEIREPGRVASGNQHQFAGGLAGGDIDLRLLRLSERIGVLHAHFEPACGDGIEDIGGARYEVLARERVELQGGTGDVERSLAGELDEVEGGDGSAGCSEERHEAAGAQDVEGFSNVDLPTES